MELAGKNLDELLEEGEQHEGEIIELPEAVFMILLNLSADLFELFALFTVIMLPFAILYGFCVSLATTIWSFMRGASGSFAVKQVIKRKVIPLLATSFFPFRSVVLTIVIVLNNKLEGKRLKKVLSLLERV